MKNWVNVLKLSVLYWSFLLLSSNSVYSQSDKPNILLIMVDDMRQELPVFGNDLIHAPNMSKLADESTVFINSFCQYPVCTPSRTSMLTGLRPDETGVYNINDNFEEIEGLDTLLTIPSYLSQHGYKSYGFGKVFHQWNASQFDFTERVRPNGFNAPGDYYTDENKLLYEEHKIGRSYEAADVHDTTYIDGWTTSRVIKSLQKHDSDTPFFMATGFFKPHLPFNVPKKYWDLYDQEDITLSELNQLPIDASKYFGFNSAELRRYIGVPGSSPIPNDLSKTLIHGYNASISYIDNQIGEIMATLEELNLRENTVVILWSDHGYKLGDYTEWAKHTLTNLDTKNVLMISDPTLMENRLVYNYVESIDLFPTICAISGITAPEYLSGVDLSSYLEQSTETAKAASAGLSQILRSRDKVMGYSLKTSKFNFNVWMNIETGEIVDKEYYLSSTDSLETINIYSSLTIKHKVFLDSVFKEVVINKNYSLLKNLPAEANSVVTEISNSALTLYPNPAKNTITLSGIPKSKYFKIKILDHLGRIIVHSRTISGKSQIDVSDFRSGVYFVIGEDKKSLLFKKKLLIL